MNTAMSNIRQLVDVNTIVGNPMQISSSIQIIPISKVGFGFASGGSEFNVKDNYNKRVIVDKKINKEQIEDEKQKYPFGGGSGATVSIKPIGFLVVQNNIVELLNIEHDSAWEKLFDYTPDVVNKISSFFEKNMINKNKENK